MRPRPIVIFFALAATALSLGMMGCGGGSEGATDTGTPAARTEQAPAAQPASPPASSSVQETAREVVKVAEESVAKVQAGAVEAAEKAQVLLDQARTLLQEKKVQEAGGLLDQVAGMTLAEDQLETLTGLKEEVQKLYGEVESGLGELKTLVEKEDYAEATTLVSKLADYELSPEQQKIYDDLKVQVQKLMESKAGQEAAKAVGNLLGR